jgi:ABC-type dipeptide/oligopeptide/nickel transport system ATPase subunit
MAFDSSNVAEASLQQGDSCRSKGNDLLNKGDYADACAQYEQGLVALARVAGSDQPRANELRLALHLNASLAHMRRGNLRSAVDHASGALAMDSRSEKGFFRRASARHKLSEHPGHEEEAKLALADFEKVVEVNPENKDAVKQVSILRSQLKKEQKDLAKSQKETYKNMFSGTKQLYDDVQKPRKPSSVIHEGLSRQEADHHTVMAADAVGYYYVRGELLLENINLKLHRGRCTGLFGNNASGKTTLARLLCGALSPTSGNIEHQNVERAAAPSTAKLFGMSSSFMSLTFSLVVAVAAILSGLALQVSAGHKPSKIAIAISKSAHWMHVVAVIVCFGLVYVAGKLLLDWYFSRRPRHSAIHVSSETSDKEEIPHGKTTEKVIGEKLPKRMLSAERRRCVVAMLKAAGFQMYDQNTGGPLGNPDEYIRDGLTYGVLSGGQKHLMYVLRCLAACPAVLVCDEVLGGLDALRQPRVLHMLRRMKEEAGTALLYITCELSQLRLISDSICFLSEGVIAEHGLVEEVFDSPKHPHTKEYVSIYRGLPGCQIIGGKLAQNYSSIKGDSDIEGEWLEMILANLR